MESVTLSRLLAVVACAVLGCSAQINAKEYYKWVDAKGVTTYSATPPPVQKQEPQLEPARQNLQRTEPSQSSMQPLSPQLRNEVKPVVASASKNTVQTGAVAATDTPEPAQTKEVKIAVKNCNGVRCWDAKGKHYSLVAGNTYLSANGGKCHKIANTMHCTK